MTTLDDLFAMRNATIVHDVIGSALAAELRDRLETGFARYALLDQGSYDALEDPDEPALIAALAKLAGERTGRPLELVDARAVRLHPGDYILSRHDRVDPAPRVEVVLDLSPTAVPGAEVHYRNHGKVFFRFPSTPGALSVIERGATVTANHTYVSKLHAPARVTRLIVALRAPGDPSDPSGQ